MPIGKTGTTAVRDWLSIRVGDVRFADKGWVCPDYRQDDGAAYMKQSFFVIVVDLGIGSSKNTVWTCDLTHSYITINADYRS